MSVPYEKYKKNGIKCARFPLIDGTYRNVAVKNLVGICHNNIHKGYLDINLLMKHDCINKNCCFLKRFEDYPFWVAESQKERRKARRRMARARANEKSERIRRAFEERMNRLLKSAQEISERLNYPIIITRVAPKISSPNNYEYIINYVSDLRKNDWHDYFDLALLMSKCHGGKYTLKHMKFPNGDYVLTSDWEIHNNLGKH